MCDGHSSSSNQKLSGKGQKPPAMFFLQGVQGRVHVQAPELGNVNEEIIVKTFVDSLTREDLACVVQWEDIEIRIKPTLTEGSELKEHPAFWCKLRPVLTWLGTLHKGGENEAMPTSVQYAGLPWATNITFTISVVNW